jgi:CheY-like chemotaxis protein
MDGIQFIEKLRERGGDDSYYIMLSIRASSEDYERGYCAGVDDYLALALAHFDVGRPERGATLAAQIGRKEAASQSEVLEQAVQPEKSFPPRLMPDESFLVWSNPR